MSHRESYNSLERRHKSHRSPDRRHRDRHERHYDRHGRRSPSRKEDKYHPRRDRSRSRSKSRRPRLGVKVDEFGRIRRDYHNNRSRSHSSSSSASSIDKDSVNPLNSQSNDPDKPTDPQKPTDPESQLQELFGFSSFNTTKGMEHSESDASLSSLRTKRKYRQYMNRVGGFNRPLSPSR